MAIAAEHEKVPASAPKGPDRLSRGELRAAIDEHASWLDSAGEAGVQADLSGKNVEGADMVDARLADSRFQKTILKGADLTLADLRGANLVQANLAEANLLGTQFLEANLQAADLNGATGLLGAQLAGTNLFGASLPESISPFAALKLVRQVAERARWFLALTLLLNGLVWLRIFTTPDAQLVSNSSALPFSGLQTTLLFIPFYLFGPVVLLSLYLCFLLYMQHLWDGVAQLPAIFPDGKKLDDSLPWFAGWLARRHFRWLKNSKSPLAFLETALAVLILYWVTPATVLLFWGRYMTIQDMRGTALHILLAVGAVTAGLNFPKMAGKAFESDSSRNGNPETVKSGRSVLMFMAVPGTIGILLFLLSVGTFLGVPHNDRTATQPGSLGIRAWAAEVLWTIGYNPYAQLTEADVSTKPRDWMGREEDFAQVKGANLNGLRLRYVEAYSAFLVRARFWQTDLRNAYLSEADLREANFRQADLRFAVLDRAKLARAALSEANLGKANLDRADVRDANLSFAVLSEATLLDATLDGSNLYKSDLHLASLQRTSLKKADLREANLEGSNLMAANLEEAYLVSTNLNAARLKNADLSKAILTDASLRKSDLSGAIFQGSVVRGADLAGANLQDADLRGAEGLTAAQVCAAGNLKGARMDEALQLQVTTLCANLN